MHQQVDDIDPAELDGMGARIAAILPAGSRDAVRTRVAELKSRSRLHWGSALLSLMSRELKRG